MQHLKVLSAACHHRSKQGQTASILAKHALRYHAGPKHSAELGCSSLWALESVLVVLPLMLTAILFKPLSVESSKRLLNRIVSRISLRERPFAHARAGHEAKSLKAQRAGGDGGCCEQ